MEWTGRRRREEIRRLQQKLVTLSIADYRWCSQMRVTRLMIVSHKLNPRIPSSLVWGKARDISFFTLAKS